MSFFNSLGLGLRSLIAMYVMNSATLFPLLIIAASSYALYSYASAPRLVSQKLEMDATMGGPLGLNHASSRIYGTSS